MKHGFRFVRLGLAAGCLAAFGLAVSTAEAVPAFNGTVEASRRFANRIEVKWNALKYASSVTVWRGTTEAFSSSRPVATVATTNSAGWSAGTWTDTTAVVMSAPYFTEFHYWIEAKNADGSTLDQNKHDSGWRNPGIPDPPPALAIYPGWSTGCIGLSWTRSNYAVTYDIRRSTDSGGTGDRSIGTVSGTATNLIFVDYSTEPGVDYWYQVVAHNPAGAARGSRTSGYRAVDLSLPDGCSFEAAAKSVSISVTANTSWTVTKESGADWLTLTSASGTNMGTIVFNVTKNPAANSRTTTLYIRAAGGTAHPKTSTLSVVQAGDSRLSEATDCPELTFTTGGGAKWALTETWTHDGQDAAKSGAIGGWQQSWMEAKVMGPALVSWWWQVSCEAGNDSLKFGMDSVWREAISGFTGEWRHRKALVGNGSHTLVWSYMKNGSVNHGFDAGVVDEVKVSAYPARKGYHDAASLEVPLGAPGAPLENSAYYPPNSRCQRRWEKQSDGTWLATITGSDGNPDILQQTLDEAEDGDTIAVWPGCYHGVTVRSNNVRIVAMMGPQQTFINGKYGKRCVDFGETTGGVVSGFTLVQGAGDCGGGIRGGAAEDCVIVGCQAVDHGNGGGAWWTKLTDCRLQGNTAEGRGGGAFGGALNRCEVRGNRAKVGGGGVAETTATGCLLAGNSSESKAGGADKSTLMNCTVADNTADVSHGGVWRCAVKNGIVVGNTAPAAANWGTGDTASTFAYTCSQPAPKGTGNFNVAPNFVNQAEGNYHLNNYSKCRDKGNKNLTKAPYDLAGLDRVMGSNIDAGCYEYATGVTPLDPADYDGDGVPDIGFFNPKTGRWFIRGTEDGTVRREKLGAEGVIVVPRDYDGDGVRDPAVYDPNTGMWKILRSSDGTVETKKLGWKGITMVDAADCDGDGKADPIIFNPKTKTWQVLQSGEGSTRVVKDFGWAGIKLVCGDYDGVGQATLAFYSPTSGNWYVWRQDGAHKTMKLGAPGVRVCPIDADFDGTLDPCYFDPAAGTWTWKSFANGWTDTVKFGDSTVTPHPFDWDGDGMPDTMGIYSPYRAGFLDHFREADGSRTAYMINF